MRFSTDVEIRPATPDDLPGEHAVFAAAQRELHDRHGVAWSPQPIDAFVRVHRHLLDHDGERSFVATAGDRVVAFSAAFVRAGTWYLSALFVHPDSQGQGVGRELLEQSWGVGFEHRITITEAIQPVSTGLYAQRGLTPTTPVLVLVGAPRAIESPLEPAEPSAGALSELDLLAYGFDRAIDHAFWAETSASGTLWLRDGRPVAYAYVSPRGVIGPVAGEDGGSAADALRAELARRTDERSVAFVPGTASAIVKAGLESGLRFEHPGLLLLTPSQTPPRSLAIASFWLL